MGFCSSRGLLTADPSRGWYRRKRFPSSRGGDQRTAYPAGAKNKDILVDAVAGVMDGLGVCRICGSLSQLLQQRPTGAWPPDPLPLGVFAGIRPDRSVEFRTLSATSGLDQQLTSLVLVKMSETIEFHPSVQQPKWGPPAGKMVCWFWRTSSSDRYLPPKRSLWLHSYGVRVACTFLLSQPGGGCCFRLADPSCSSRRAIELCNKSVSWRLT